MRRFDFQRDDRLDWLERALACLRSAHLRAPASAALGLVAVTVAAVAVEIIGLRGALDARRVDAARSSELRSTSLASAAEMRRAARLAGAGAMAAATQRSGAGIAARIASVGNAIPSTAWLTEIDAGSDGIVVMGDADDLQSVDAVIAALSVRGVEPALGSVAIDPGDDVHFTFTQARVP